MFINVITGYISTFRGFQVDIFVSISYQRQTNLAKYEHCHVT